MPLSDADRFAELVDSDDFSADKSPDTDSRELLRLVAALREMDFDASPTELTRGLQRRRLVAMAAVRTHAEPEPAAPGRHRAQNARSDGERAGVWAGFSSRLRGTGSGRRVLAGVAGLSVIVATLGILALLAQSAIPGDTLYALKRGTEQARLALAGDDQAEGRVLLGFATTRLEELNLLLDEPVALVATGSGVQAADAASTADLLITTMETMDEQTAKGTNAMTSAAVDEAQADLLAFVGEWGIEQFETLDALSARMPNQARDRAEDSKNLLQRVVERLNALAQNLRCDETDPPSTDDLGPLPRSGCSNTYAESTTSASGPDGGAGGAASSAPGATEAPAGSTSPPVPAPSSTATQEPAPPVEPPIGPPVEPPVDPPVEPPVEPPVIPPLEGSPCFIGLESGIIQGGVCVLLPVVPPPPNEGEPCILIDLPWPLDDIMGIIVGGICVIG